MIARIFSPVKDNRDGPITLLTQVRLSTHFSPTKFFPVLIFTYIDILIMTYVAQLLHHSLEIGRGNQYPGP